MTPASSISKHVSLEQSSCIKACLGWIKPSEESSPKKTFPLVFSVLNRPHETLHLNSHQGLSQKGHLLAWIQKDAVVEEVAVKGFRGVEGQELLGKVLLLGPKNLVAIRTSQAVVLLPRLQGAALDDADVTEGFINRFNENTLNADYKAKAMEFVSKFREIGGLEDLPATALNEVLPGFVLLAKCQDERVIQAAMLSLYEFEEKSRAGLLKQECKAPSSLSSVGSFSARTRTVSSQSTGRMSGSVAESFFQAFFKLLEIVDSAYFLTMTPDTQCLVLKAYNCLLDSLIFYSGQEGQVPLVYRIQEARRKNLLTQLQKVIEVTQTKSHPEVTYLGRLALEGSKRLADDASAWEKGALRIVTFCAVLKAAWDKDSFNALESPKDWYEFAYVIREMGRSVLQDRRHFIKFMQLINDKKVEKGSWELLYTVASSLGEMIRSSLDTHEGLSALEKLGTLACFKGHSSLFSKPNEMEVSRIRYKAAEALKRLQNHQDAAIAKKVSLYLCEREAQESTPYIKNLLTTPFFPPEQSLQELLPPKKARPQEPAQQNAQATILPPQAFGKKEWEKYFGDVGVEPCLTANIHQILQSPCPIWPDKRIADTHLLTLIPQTVNGKPLSLDYLGELIQTPKEGGNTSQYRHYHDDVKNTIGAKSIEHSYWLLLTKYVLPNTREKSFHDQDQELESWKKKSSAFKEGGYRDPKTLEVAISVLMEHTRSGKRFYSDAEGENVEWTYTRCEELTRRGEPVLIGAFKSSGIAIDALDPEIYLNDLGLGVARKV